jgi:hypothetical protein
MPNIRPAQESDVEELLNLLPKTTGFKTYLIEISRLSMSICGCFFPEQIK